MRGDGNGGVFNPQNLGDVQYAKTLPEHAKP
jgi:hypothetical protein